MITGTLYFTSDTNVVFDFVRQDPQNNVVVAISQNVDPQFVNQCGALVASILTPTYECFMHEVNNDMDGFCTMYYEHLNRKECMDYIASILKALTVGKNNILYATPDEAQTNYVNVFKAYLAQTFGIVCGDQYIQFSWMQNYFINIAMTLYMFDLYTSHDLFEAWKMVPTVEFNDGLILKLIRELNPPVPSNYTLQEYNQYFLRMAVGYNNQQLQIPAIIQR